jgi:hypothetical protein
MKKGAVIGLVLHAADWLKEKISLMFSGIKEAVVVNVSNTQIT